MQSGLSATSYAQVGVLTTGKDVDRSSEVRTGRIPVSRTRSFPPSVPGRARPLGEPPLPHFPLFQAVCQTPPQTAGVEPGPPENTSMGCFLSLEGRLPRRPGSFCISLIGDSSIREWVECPALLVSESGKRPSAPCAACGRIGRFVLRPARKNINICN